MSADSPVGVAEEPKQELEEKEVAEGEKEGDEGPTKKRKLNDSAKAPLVWSTDQIAATKQAAVDRLPFTPTELDRAVGALRNLAAPHTVDWAAVRRLLGEVAHLPHQQWDRTEAAAQTLSDLLSGPGSPVFQQIFARALEGGGWATAAAAAARRPATDRPWVVLVTGLNGIRKTTSVYQPWFRDALARTLPPEVTTAPEFLPVGPNSFFRQLDFIVATVANEDFRALYQLEDLAQYSAGKDAIFARYRTVAEMVGVLLLREAQRLRLNIMVETSGRDVAMFQYIDHFFPDTSYHKMTFNLTINDVRYAEHSVDVRMADELKAGQAVVAAGATPASVVAVNAGGPYSAAALRRVQEEAQRVWRRVEAGDVAADWHRATFAVHACDDGDWYVETRGDPTRHYFERRQ